MAYTFQTIAAPGADLGTFLGGVNNAGQVAGYSLSTAVPVPQGFVDTAGTFTPIAGVFHARPNDINNSGVVVGASGDAIVGLDAFLWNPDGSSQKIHPRLSGTVDLISATGINDAGTVVGFVAGNPLDGNPTHDDGAPAGTSGFVWQNGAVASVVQVPGVSATEARGLSNGGIIVGFYNDGFGSTGMGPVIDHPFVDVNGAITTIDVPGSVSAEANGISPDGSIIVGSYSDGTHEHGWIDVAGNITTVDQPGAADTQISGVNDARTLVGGNTDANGIGQAFIATDPVPSPPTPDPVPIPAPVPQPPPVAAIAVFDTSTQTAVPAAGTPYTGPVAGLQNEYINLTSDNINVTASTANWFIHSGSGMDAIAANSGTNVLDGGTGSNFLSGGSGTDTFFVDDRNAPADIWSTVVGFHAGDAATIWGVTPQDFALDWADGQGAAGFTGLTLHATAAGRPIASLTLAGYSSGDLGGRLAVQFGTDTASGSSFMFVHGS